MILIALFLAQAAAPVDEKARCFEEVRGQGPVFMRYIGDRACVNLTPPRRISGLWIDKFEGSSFHEGLTNPSQLQGRKHTTWLSIDDQSVLPQRLKPSHRGQIYRITFIGRTARDMARTPLEGYGHFGMSPGLVLVDRVLEWEDLGPLADR